MIRSYAVASTRTTQLYDRQRDEVSLTEVAAFQPNGPMLYENNAFFLDLGTNGRTCFTCHQPEDGWTISAQHAGDRFKADSNDPLFRLVDAATCSSVDVSTLRAKRKAYSLLREKGLIRIGLRFRPSHCNFRFSM